MMYSIFDRIRLFFINFTFKVKVIWFALVVVICVSFCMANTHIIAIKVPFTNPARELFAPAFVFFLLLHPIFVALIWPFNAFAVPKSILSKKDKK